MLLVLRRVSFLEIHPLELIRDTFPCTEFRACDGVFGIVIPRLERWPRLLGHVAVVGIGRVARGLMLVFMLDMLLCLVLVCNMLVLNLMLV